MLAGTERTECHHTGLGLGPSVEAEQGSGGRARAGDSDGAVMAGRDEAHEVPKATLIFRSSRRGRARLSWISSSLARARARATERVLLVLVIVFFSERRTGILRVCARTGRKDWKTRVRMMEGGFGPGRAR